MGWQVEGRKLNAADRRTGRVEADCASTSARCGTLAWRTQLRCRHHESRDRTRPRPGGAPERVPSHPHANLSGSLIAVTPNANGYGHHRFRSNWMPLEPPRHLHLLLATNPATHGASGGLLPAGMLDNCGGKAQFFFESSQDIERVGRHDVTRARVFDEVSRRWLFNSGRWPSIRSAKTPATSLCFERENENCGDHALLGAKLAVMCGICCLVASGPAMIKTTIASPILTRAYTVRNPPYHG